MAERLIESVNMVKELLESNRQLRDLIDKKSGDYDKSQNEVVMLQLENQDLKDKIDILTKLSRPPNVEDAVNSGIPNLFPGDFTGNTSGNEQLAQEVLELKRTIRVYEEKLKKQEIKDSTTIESYNTSNNEGASYMKKRIPVKRKSSAKERSERIKSSDHSSYNNNKDIRVKKKSWLPPPTYADATVKNTSFLDHNKEEALAKLSEMLNDRVNRNNNKKY